MTLTDTNILLRSLYPDHPHYTLAKSAINTLQNRDEILCVAPQNIIEFWTVATRPRGQNGLGLVILEAAERLKDIRALFRLLPNTPDVFDIWNQLVINNKVIGKATHDAHIVAVMQAHSVSSILTFNIEDFKRFPGINVLDPADI